jgi:hypothetical protein
MAKFQLGGNLSQYYRCNRPDISISDHAGLKKKMYFFSVTTTKVGELNSIFTLNSNMFSVFLHHVRFLSDIQL